MFSPSEIVKLRYFTVSSTSLGVTNMVKHSCEEISFLPEILSVSTSSSASRRCHGIMDNSCRIYYGGYSDPDHFYLQIFFCKPHSVIAYTGTRVDSCICDLNCTVQASALLAASASMAITMSGFVCHDSCMISDVSIPVCAITPG